ncbi:TIGR00269 family protein [Candidatus Woesearchaeota archaeon]|nr:TIGR00269 family protein [Candidatus Woesearchaeota archaeon]
MKYFEDKVFDTIKRFRMITPSDRVCVAVSGGKDSLSVLYLVKKFLDAKKGGGSVVALAINEGIEGYRQKTLDDLKLFCSQQKIELRLLSYKEEFGTTLDYLVQQKKIAGKPCGACGTFRRSLLNRGSKGFDKLVTGHNMDDEVQAIMMNIFRHHLELALRSGPKTPQNPAGLFVQRVKPLYFCSEKEVRLYAHLQGFLTTFTECPNAAVSFRASVRDFINEYEAKCPGTKSMIVQWFLDTIGKDSSKKRSVISSVCLACGEPAVGTRCGSCTIVEQLRA